MNQKFVEVAIPLPLRGPLIYRLPPEMASRSVPGLRVKVPLGPRQVIGCLLGGTAEKPSFQTREVLECLDADPILSPSEVKLLKWASAYYLTPMGEVLRHFLPPRMWTRANPKGSERRKKSLPDCDLFAIPPATHLTPEQKEALGIIREEMKKESPGPILLHGVTGSGKTEVYLEVVRQALQEGGQALILVPEIGLTPQLVGRFQTLDRSAAVYHSGLTPAQRLSVWREAREGKRPVVIATRSGIFLRFPNLKVLLIDEEHDSSYKQEERFCYHARDLALWRGREEKILVLLGSATPSLETLQRAERGQTRKIRLLQRPGGIGLPVIETIDRRDRFQEKDGHPIFSKLLLDAIAENLKKMEQSLLFLNRRGFSPFVLCPSCGFVPRCEQCDISLTLHRRETGPSTLLCHFCDREKTYLSPCPKCQKGALTPFGFGTERIEKELRRLFPHARIGRLDRDTSRGGGWQKVLERMKKRELDILIGTQMITKGHDYPFLTLVGIVDADVALNLPDFRAGERTFQLITQVSGRAGRGEKPGRVLIQTFQPEHEGLIDAATADGDKFYARELEERREAGYPPFKRLVEIRLSGLQRETVVEKSRLLSKKIRGAIPPPEGILLGPAPCSIEKVRGRTRWRLLIKTSHYARIQPRLRRLLDDFAENDLPSRLRMLVNVDPVEMM